MKEAREHRSSESSKGSTLSPRETSRQDTGSSLEESVVVPVTRLLLQVDSPQVRLIEGFVNGPLAERPMPVVDEPTNVEVHTDKVGSLDETSGKSSPQDSEDGGLGLGFLDSDEVRWDPGVCFQPPLPRTRSYPSIPSIISFPSIPSLLSISSFASIPSISSSPSADIALANILGLSDSLSSDDSGSARVSWSREIAPHRNTIPFPRLPDVEVPDKPGWILQYVNGCYASIPSSIPREQRKAWAGGKIRIFQAALPIIQGEAAMGDWDELLEAFDADPFNWMANPPIMVFRRVSELELDLKHEYEATPINWVLSILYEVHSWIRGDTEKVQEMRSSLEVAFTRIGWAKGMPPRFVQYLSYVGLAMYMSPSGLEILEVIPRDPRDI